MQNYSIRRHTIAVTVPINNDTEDAPVLGAGGGSDELNGVLKGITLNAPNLTGSSYILTVLGQRGETLFTKSSIVKNVLTYIGVDANNHPLSIPLALKGVSPLRIKSTGTPDATGVLTFSNNGAITDGKIVTIGGQVYRLKTTIAQANDVLIEPDVAASAVLTWANTVNVTNGKKVVAGSMEYTYKTALTEAFATALLSSNNTEVADGATVTIGGVTYRIVDTMTQINDVQRDGTTADTTLQHLIDAVNHTGTEGTDYFTGTEINPLASAGSIVSHEITFTNKVKGVIGNSTTKASTSANLTWDAGGAGSTFSGGADAVVNEVLIGSNGDDSLLNLKKAINNEAGEGTKYSTGTVINPDISSSAVSSHALTMTAKVAGTSGNSLAKSTDEATLDWDGVGATFTAGAWSGDSTLTNLVAAIGKINTGGESGVKYHADTVANAYVTSSAVASHAITVTAVEGVDAPTSVNTLSNETRLTWGAATLVGGGEAAARSFEIDFLIANNY